MRCNIVVICFWGRIEGHGKFLKKHSLKLSLILVFLKNFVLVFVFSNDTYFNFQMTLKGTVNFYFYEKETGICWQSIFFSLILLISLVFPESLFVILMLMIVIAAAHLSWNSLMPGTILSNYILDILPSQHIYKIEGVNIPSYRWGNWPHVYVKYLLFLRSLHLYEYFC